MTGPLDHAHDVGAFRAALRAWLPGAKPADWRRRVSEGGEDGFVEVQREWYDTLTRAGLSTAHWPEQWGGVGLPLAQQIVYYEELARADAPNTENYVISFYHMPATLFAHGTPDQRERYLEGARTGGAIWCQGFSEPGAGSDLASLRTRAERKGDVYVVNGQKIWSSYGKLADHCLLLARTDPTAERKQAGISYMIVDMDSPGLTVRPIRQITGEAEFCELFFDDVEVPVANLIGAENDGWRIAQSTLTAERGLLIFEHTERIGYAYVRDAARGGDSWMKDPVLKREFAAFWPRIRAIKHMMRGLLDVLLVDPHGGGDLATYIKLYWGVLLQDYTLFMTRAEGLAAQVETGKIRCAGHNSGDYLYDFMWSYGWTIAGGSNEVIRNIISERLMGLPR